MIAVEGFAKSRSVVALVPVTNPEDVFAVLGWGGWNGSPSPEEHAAVHRYWQQRTLLDRGPRDPRLLLVAPVGPSQRALCSRYTKRLAWQAAATLDELPQSGRLTHNANRGTGGQRLK